MIMISSIVTIEYNLLNSKCSKLIYFFPPKDFSAASIALCLAALPLDAFPSGPVPNGVTAPGTPPAEYSSTKSSSSSSL